MRKAGEKGHVTAERQALVADLRGGRHDDVADPVVRSLRVATQELAYGLDGHVVGARLPEDAGLAGAAERRAHPVDVHDLSELARHRSAGYRCVD